MARFSLFHGLGRSFDKACHPRLSGNISQVLRNKAHFIVFQIRVHGQAEDPFRTIFTYWKVPSLIAQGSEGGLQMQGFGVVHCRRDALLLQAVASSGAMPFAFSDQRVLSP